MSKDSIDPAKYAEADTKLLELILSEADKRVQAQVQLMLAADQRANGILAGCITLAGGGIGFAMAQYPKLTPLFWSSLSFGVVELLAAFAALMALWPAAVNPQGWAPATFDSDLKKAMALVQAEIAKYLQERIEGNRTCASRLARLIKLAMLLALEAPAVGLSAGLASAGYLGTARFVAGCAAFLGIAIGLPLIVSALKQGSK